MKVKRWCESCGKEFEWDNECKCGKNKHRPICSPCSKINFEASMKNYAAEKAELILEEIDRRVIDGWNR